MQQHGQVLSVLVELKSTAESFTQELRQSLLGVDVAELQPIAAAVFAPFESQISRYVAHQQTCGICDTCSSEGCLHSTLYAAVKQSLLSQQPAVLVCSELWLSAYKLSTANGLKLAAQCGRGERKQSTLDMHVATETKRAGRM